MNKRIEKSVLLIITGIFLGAIFLVINNIDKIIQNKTLMIVVIIGIIGIAVITTLTLLPYASEEKLVNKIKKEQNEK